MATKSIQFIPDLQNSSRAAVAQARSTNSSVKNTMQTHYDPKRIRELRLGRVILRQSLQAKRQRGDDNQDENENADDRRRDGRLRLVEQQLPAALARAEIRAEIHRRLFDAFHQTTGHVAVVGCPSGWITVVLLTLSSALRPDAAERSSSWRLSRALFRAQSKHTACQSGSLTETTLPCLRSASGHTRGKAPP